MGVNPFMRAIVERPTSNESFSSTTAKNALTAAKLTMTSDVASLNDVEVSSSAQTSTTKISSVFPIARPMPMPMPMPLPIVKIATSPASSTTPTAQFDVPAFRPLPLPLPLPFTQLPDTSSSTTSSSFSAGTAETFLLRPRPMPYPIILVTPASTSTVGTTTEFPRFVDFGIPVVRPMPFLINQATTALLTINASQNNVASSTVPFLKSSTAVTTSSPMTKIINFVATRTLVQTTKSYRGLFRRTTTKKRKRRNQRRRRIQILRQNRKRQTLANQNY